MWNWLTSVKQPDPRWKSQLIDATKNKNDDNTVDFTESDLKFGLVQAESHPHPTLWALTDHTRYMSKTLGWRQC